LAGEGEGTLLIGDGEEEKLVGTPMRGAATAGREERSSRAVDKVGDGGADEVGDGSSDGEENVVPTTVRDGNRGITGAGATKN
jgi:hypothetical protein